MQIKFEQSDWGPQAWSFIHYIALSYPDNPTEEDKNNYKDFYINLQNVLPCPKCASNYKDNLERIPIDTSLVGNKELFKWTIDIHNMVNNELGKRKYTYEEVFKIYLKDTSKETNNIFIIISGALLIILVGYLIIKNIK